MFSRVVTAAICLLVVNANTQISAQAQQASLDQTVEPPVQTYAMPDADHANTSDTATQSDFATEAGALGRTSYKLGRYGFMRTLTGHSVRARSFNIPSGAHTVFVEALCRTVNNDRGNEQAARVDVWFNAGFTESVTVCFSGRNNSDHDHQTGSGTTSMQIPQGANRIFVLHAVRGGDAASEAQTYLHWLGQSGSTTRSVDLGTAQSSSLAASRDRNQSGWRCQHCRDF